MAKGQGGSQPNLKGTALLPIAGALPAGMRKWAAGAFAGPLALLAPDEWWGGEKSDAGRKTLEAAQGYWAPSTKPRRMMFRQLESALTTGGGKGFKSPFVQQAVARSQAAGRAGLAGANTTLAGTDPAMRSMILNRIGRSNTMNANRIAPSVASQMIAGAPDIVNNQASSINAGFGNLLAGAQQAAQEQAIRAAGYSALASGVGTAAGAGAGSAFASGGRPASPGGSWFNRFFNSGATN